MSQPCLKTIRLLAECFQAFSQFSSRHIRQLGLTSAQFDIIATLGNTPGMSCKQLGEKTLITKGTLTGVVERLVAKGLLSRQPDLQDARCFRLQLTQAGQQLFEQIFPLHLAYCQQAFESMTEPQMQQLQQGLSELRQLFVQGMQQQLPPSPVLISTGENA